MGGRMKTRSPLLGLLLGLVLMITAGCGGMIQTNTNAYKNPAVQAIDKLGPFRVVRNQQAANPLLDNEIATKLESALSSKGFVVTDQDNARYLVAFDYSISAGVESGITPIFTPGQTSTITTQGPSGGYMSQTVTSPGTTSYVPTTNTVFTRRMTVRVWPNPRAAGDNLPLWIGEAVSRGSKDDLRMISGYLVKAIAEQFGEDSKEAVKRMWSYHD